MTARALLLALLLVSAAGCGRSEAPPVDAARQREEALEASRKGVFGDQVKALDKAKGLQEELNKKAQEGVDKAEKDATRYP